MAQDGSGTYETLGEAVGAAVDGDSVLVRPGRYVENVAMLGKDIAIAGDGGRNDIVLEQAPNGPSPDFDWSLYFDAGDERSASRT